MTKQVSTKIIAALSLAAGLGLAALPACTFADTTETATVTVTIDTAISLRGSTNKESVSMTAGGTNNEIATTLYATTNSSTGYNITASILDSGSTALVNSGDSIPSYTSASALSSSTAGWGLAVSGTETTDTAFPLLSDSKYLGLLSESSRIVCKSAALTSGVEDRDTIVTYGIAVGTSPVSGDYTGGVKYTIAANS